MNLSHTLAFKQNSHLSISFIDESNMPLKSIFGPQKCNFWIKFTILPTKQNYEHFKILLLFCLAPISNGARKPNVGPAPKLLLVAAITGHEHFVGVRGGEREHHGVEELRTADSLRTIRVLANSVKIVFLDNFIIQL